MGLEFIVVLFLFTVFVVVCCDPASCPLDISVPSNPRVTILANTTGTEQRRSYYVTQNARSVHHRTTG